MEIKNKENNKMKFTLPILEKTKMLFITLLTFSGLLLINDNTTAGDKTLYEKSFAVKVEKD